MSKKWNNIFFAFGIVAIIFMAFTFDTDWQVIGNMLSKMGILFPLIVLLWLFIYLLNACSWNAIIKDGKTPKVPFLQVLKMTIAGFALNYATPLGLMGGEPYRIMALSPYVGNKKATSSVILYVMMHIFSHFCFWLTAIIIYVVLHFAGMDRYELNLWGGLVMAIVAFVFLLLINLFLKGFKHGFVVSVLGFVKRLPFAKKWAVSFSEKHTESLQKIDEQIGELRCNRKVAFWKSLLLEYIARFVGCIEYWIIIKVLMPDVTYFDSVMLVAFSSLFSNLMFFMPMQLGAREGGMALATGGMSMPGSYGLYTSLVTRIREAIWIVIGVLLMKVANKKVSADERSID